MLVLVLWGGALLATRDSAPAEGDPSPVSAGPEPCTPVRGDRMLGDALLHVPRGAAAPLALVIAFHGARGTGPGFAEESGLSGTADRHGFAVLYPTAGSTRHFWSLNRSMRPDDLARLRTLLPRAMNAACGDPKRVYATGVSNGGGFAARVGCEMSGTIVAIAPVAGGYRALDDCPSDRRTSVLEIHGTADHVVPYAGRGPQHEGDPQDFVTDWARRDGCRVATVETRPRPLAHRFRHRHCPVGLAAEHIRLDGTDHGWPGADPPYPRHNPSGLQADEVVWRFFTSVRAP